MPGGRHVSQPVDSTLTIADIVAARHDYERSLRRPDAETRETTWRWTFGPLAATVLLGVVIGATVPSSGLGPKGFRGRISNILGWTYFACWSFAEYPPLYLNFSQKAVLGESLDHTIYYLIGDVSYTAFNSILLWSRVCHSQQEGCRGRAESIHLPDALYSILSTLCTAVLIAQLLVYSPRKVEVSLQCWVVLVSVAIIGGGGLVLTLQDSNYLTLPSYVYGISLLRVGSCIMEQMPSTDMELRPESKLRQRLHSSTQTALLAGSLLSLAQQIYDAASNKDWAVISNNLTKLLLGLLTGTFSLIMFLRASNVLTNWRLRHKQQPKAHETSSREREEQLDMLNETLIN